MSYQTKSIVPFLWFAKDAEEATRFYASIFPNSHVDRVITMPADSPAGPEGSVKSVEFTLLGQKFGAMTAGPHHDFNDAISFMVPCETQEEIDRYWNAILENGGKEIECGWINDRWGVRWQIVPKILDDLLADPDKEKAKRATQEMLKEKKLDIAKLRAAFDGKKAS